MAKRDAGLRFQPSGGMKAAQVPTGKKQRLTIERLANDGRGIAFLDGRTWFVAGALPGEDVEARRSFIVRNAKDIRFLDV